MSLKTWCDAADVEIDELLNSKPTKENAILLNSLLGILNYEKSQEAINQAETPNNNVMVDYLTYTNDDEDIQRFLQEFVSWRKNKDKYQLTQSPDAKHKMIMSFKMMVNIHSDLVKSVKACIDCEEEKQIWEKYFHAKTTNI